MPLRIKPHTIISTLNESIKIGAENLKLRVRQDAQQGDIEGTLEFVWFPRSTVEFSGFYKGPHPNFEDDSCTLSMPGIADEFPVLLTSISPRDGGNEVRGIIKSRAIRKTASQFNNYVFHLINFPDYIGLRIRTENENQCTMFTGRISLDCRDFKGNLDAIPEVRELRKEYERKGGFFLSHVGEIKARNGKDITESTLLKLQESLFHFFGFCRGSWAGPVFPIGVRDDNVVWEQFASWHTGSFKKVYTWLPTRKYLKDFNLFSGFYEKFNDPLWNYPLIHAIHWYVEANQPDNKNATRVILSQLVLEMLSWIYLVDYKKKYTEEKFSKKNANQRIRALLKEMKIPVKIPDYLNELQDFARNKLANKDAPGVIAWIRNALVHSSEDNRQLIQYLDGLQFYQLAQMSLNFVELVILAICDYDGPYVRRGWKGWKGDDEVPVPWI